MLRFYNAMFDRKIHSNHVIITHSNILFFNRIEKTHHENRHLSHYIDTLTQFSHTNACYCDPYPQIGA